MDDIGCPVKFRHPITGDWVFGYEVHPTSENLTEGVRLIVDALTPAMYRILTTGVLTCSNLIPDAHNPYSYVSGFGIVGDDPFSRFVFDDFLQAKKAEQKLPKDRPRVGHLLLVLTENGQIAYYRIMEIKHLMGRIEWRGWKGRVVDSRLGWSDWIDMRTLSTLLKSSRQFEKEAWQG